MPVQLIITTTPAQIGIDQTQAQLQLQTHIPQLPRRTRMPEVSIRREEPRIAIDQSHVRGELGFREPVPFARHCAGLGREEAAAGIRRTAREGDRLARFHEGGDAIAALARENARDSAEVNLALWPTRPPEITVEPGQLEIKAKPGGTKAAYAPARVEGDFTRGVVQVYLRQQPGIEIRAVLDRRV